MTKTEEFILKEYKDEIHEAIAICKYFRISYERFFKEKFLINYAYEHHDITTFYTNDELLKKYNMAVVYCDLYKKYYKKRFALNYSMLKMILQAKCIIISIANIFNCDIMKLIAFKKD